MILVLEPNTRPESVDYRMLTAQLERLSNVDFRVHRDAMVWPMVAAGTSNDDIKHARDMAPKWDEDDLEGPETRIR